MNTALAFLVTLGILIWVHEYGHYRVARWCGVRVLRFSIGFGPVIWRRQARPGATEYTLAALPLGGFVQMLDSREGSVPPDAAHQAFDTQPLRKRVAITAAGPAANLLLAVVIWAGLYWWGVPEPEPVLATPPAASLAAQAGVLAGDRVYATAQGDGEADWHEVGSLNEVTRRAVAAGMDGEPLRLEVSRHGHDSGRLVLTLPLHEPLDDINAGTLAHIGLVGAYSEPVLGDIPAGGAAARAGLQPGDRVLRVDGQVVPDAQWLRLAVREHPEVAMAWQVERAGQVLGIIVTPARVTAADGSTIGRIEAVVGRPPTLVTVRRGPVDGLTRALAQTWDDAQLSLRMFGRMLTGQASLKNLSGPVTIADYAGQSAQRGAQPFLAFLAVVSVGLAVLNLLPLPILDGGHLMYYLFEGLTGRPVSAAWMQRLQRLGLVLLVALMSLALFNDMARLVGAS